MKKLIVFFTILSSAVIIAQERGRWYIVGKKPGTFTPMANPCPSGTSASVVPCGFGYGMSTRAAYGCGTNPTIYRINTLADDASDTTNGDGTHSSSLYAAISASGPRVIVFERSGYIDMGGDFDITNPCLTIAGQTAPSPGITVRAATGATVSSGGFGIRTHDILIQHIRVRPGDRDPVLANTAGHNIIQLYHGGNTMIRSNIHHVVLDHVSFSWAAGKIFDIFRAANDTQVSVWKSIFSEALFRAKNITDTWGPPGQVSGLNAAIGDDDGQNYTVTMYGNIFAHNPERNPEIGSGDNLHFINNVVYDFGQDPNGSFCYAMLLYVPNGPYPWLTDTIGNVWIGGPGTRQFSTCAAIKAYSGNTGSKYYLSDNVSDFTVTSCSPACVLLDDNSTGFQVFSPALSESGFTILAGSATKSAVLNWAGARPRDRDGTDSRIITEITNHTATLGTSCPSLTYPNAANPALYGRICSQTDVGSWPTLTNNTNTFALPSNPHTVTASGYTNLEVYLHTLADQVEQ